MLTWTGEFGVGTIISAATALGVALTFVKGLGLREADHRTLAKRFERLEADVAALTTRHVQGQDSDRVERDKIREWVTGLRDEAQLKRDNFSAAVTANAEMMRSMVLEMRREIAERYATKEDVVQLENRTSKGIDRMNDQIEKIGDRLDTITDMLAGNRHR